MRIAYMLTSLCVGGAERQVLALADRMKANGHDVVLLVLRLRQAHEFPAEVEIIRLNMTKSPPGVLAGLLRARSFFEQFRPDLVHSHTFPSNMAARMLRLMGAAPKVVSTIHNIYEGTWSRTLAYRLTDPLCSHTTAVSQAVADRYVRIGAVPRHKSSVITNGIDVEAFAPTHARAFPQSGLQRKPGEFIWLAAGRNVPAKDFANLLTAFQRVCVEEPGARLRIAGGDDTRYAATPEEHVQSDQVRWLGLCDDMPGTIASADAFVLSSAWEGMPLVVGEAMAMEKPVVATDVGGVRELVGTAGVIVPPKDSCALSDAMLRVMRMPEGQRKELGQAARTRIVSNFDINARTRAWEALYQELLDGGLEHAALSPW